MQTKNSLGDDMPRSINKDEKILKSIGTRIHKLRGQKGITQAVLSASLGVEPETLSRYERGIITVSISQLYEIARCLDVPIGTLLGSGKPGKEGELLDRFGLLDKPGQDLILGLLRKMTG